MPKKHKNRAFLDGARVLNQTEERASELPVGWLVGCLIESPWRQEVIITAWAVEGCSRGA